MVILHITCYIRIDSIEQICAILFYTYCRFKVKFVLIWFDFKVIITIEPIIGIHWIMHVYSSNLHFQLLSSMVVQPDMIDYVNWQCCI